MELAKAYNPKEAESTHYQRWESAGYFSPEINQDPDARPFSIVIPPPNVTGSLHMGHALQHTLMDVLTRWKRMQGYRTLFLPGTDHAGISTQLMVTRQLKKDEGKTPQQIGREAFTAKVWEWKEQFGGTITNQMRREGLSIDWSRERFTMDESLSRAVREVFVRLYEEGFIYRGKRIVNWCPNDKTVLSDLEVQDEKKQGKLVYLQYPVKDSDRKVTVATTRPETMLGDTAVAVNPEDERYRDLVGKTIVLPLTGREIPVIADEYVDAAFGTGCVKITPAHDPNDYEVGIRHDLPQIEVMNLDATMNSNAGVEFKGLDRFAARQLVIEKFAELGLLEKEDDYEISLPLCERCKTIIEPMLSIQWFVRMDEMRSMALDLMRKEKSPHFVPQVPHEKLYIEWLENLKDWTISRQLWWGHQIPAWYDTEGNVFIARSASEAAKLAGTSDLVQDEDVLDTWFSSALWAFSTLGWNGEVTETEELKTFYPTSVLITGRDIIRLWVSRMVMTGLKFIGERPFYDVYVTGTVLDKNGQRMSKTKGNGVDPLDVFDKYGVDATRMYLASSASGIDIRWNDAQIENYRNFSNKIWNASRFCLMNSEGASVDPDSLQLTEADSIADKWIVSRLNKTAAGVSKALEEYQFHIAVRLLYHFFWDDFCDWYIELAKDNITGPRPADPVEGEEPPPSAPVTAERAAARTRIITILEQALRLLHPFMPYLTEELWHKLPGADSELHNPAYKAADASVMLADFPRSELAFEKAESEMQSVIELISRVRNIRSELNIKPSEKVSVHVAAETALQTVFRANKAQILKLSRAEQLILSEKLDVPKASARAVIGGAEVAIPLEGLIDFEKESERLARETEKLVAEKQKLDGQLANANFVDRAPAEKVAELRDRVTDIEQRTNSLKQTLEALK
jgi:valyl-tRNA synthetase